MPSPRYTVRLPPALDTPVQERVRQGTPFAVLIREALAAYLADTTPTGTPISADSTDMVRKLQEQLATLTMRVEALEQVPTHRRQSANRAPTSADRNAGTPATPHKGRRPSPLRGRLLYLLHAHTR